MRTSFFRLLAIFAACFATPWTLWHQRKIKKRGRGLDTQELGVAEALGLSDPESIFIAVVQRVPNPLSPFLYLARGCGASCITEAAGITLGRGIYVAVESKDSLELIAHELVHVRQYHEAGSVWAFMVEYLYQCLAVGYYDAEWEREARSESARVLALRPTYF